MKLVNKACFIVTMGVVIGLRHHAFRPKSHTIWQVVGPSVSQANQRQVAVAFGPSHEASRKTKKPRAVKEPLRAIAYLSCWGPYQ
ncbi:hypothetical protein Hanom_Chr11g00987571 [Helianthus anomalus]